MNRISRRTVVTIITSTLLLFGALCAALPGTIDGFASGCANGDTAHIVVKGETLSAIAATFHQTYISIQQYNHIANANLIYIGETICILSSSSHSTMVPLSTEQNSAMLSMASMAIAGLSDPFAYGQCTYWASLRYHAYSGIWVPWATQSDAHQWVDRAIQYRWNVNNKPILGSIAVFQSGVQGAFSLGHVAVVERLLGNGQFIASSMNWNFMGANVAYTQFHAGAGVSFLTY